MKNIYWQIARTYWSRPLVLLIGIVFILMMVLLTFGETDGNVFSIGARPERSGPHYYVYTEFEAEDSQEMDLETVDQLASRIDPLKVRGLNVQRMNIGDPLPDLSQFKNLQSLSLSLFDLTVDDVAMICLLPELQSLTFFVGELPDGSLAAIGQKVSQLEVTGSLLEKYPEDVPHLTAVKLLAVNVYHASDDLLRVVTLAPQIEELSLIESKSAGRRPDPNWSVIDLTDAEIALLRNHPTLKDVYANWHYMEHTKGFNSKSLSPKRAIPDHYSENQLRGITFMGFAGALLFALLSLNLWAHFISPAAAVVPSYLSKHRRFAVGVTVIGLTVIWIALLRYDIAALPALALILLVPAFCSLFACVQLTGVKSLQIVLVPITIFGCFFVPILSQHVFQMIAAEAVWFLDGNFPEFTACIVVIELGLISWVFFSLHAITTMAHESFTSTPAFSPWDTQRMKKAQFQKNNFALKWFDSGIQGLRYCGGSLWKMIHLWRMGNPFRPMVFMMFLLPLFGMMLIIQIVKTLLEGGEVVPGDFIWLSGVAITPVSFGVIMPTMIWWQRRNSLEAESLRPVNREALGKQLYLSLAMDHWIVLISFGILFLFGYLQGKMSDPEMLAMSILGFIVAPLWIVGCSACVLVFKRLWVVIASMIGIYVFAFGSLITLAVISEMDLDDGAININSPLVIVGIGVLAMTLGIALNWVMYRFTLRREWG